MKVVRHALALLGLVLVIGGVAWRAPPPDPDGADIVIERAAVRREASGRVLDVRAEVQLPVAVRQGLDSGVPLDFLVELAVTAPRALLPDRRVGGARWSYRLVYYELTRHYRLGASDGTDARNYRSLMSALEGLGELRGLSIPEAGGDDRYAWSAPADGAPGVRSAAPDGRGGAAPADLQATLTMRLDTRALPLPLQPLIGSPWRMRAVPFTWRVEA